MEEQKNISFRLKNIELSQSSLSVVSDSITNDTIFKFNINIEHLVNLNENVIAIKPIVEIFIEENNNKTILGGLSASLIFEFENLPSFVIDNEVKLPTDIIIAINSISISTIRGIMFSTFKGTYLHNAFLPIIDPKSFNINK
ncbi:hypothetical protein AB3G33_10430 [Flavobacterium sp. WC2421]|uniref:hypothetical protein n=1 Tax=Flavobacterium sp. WC2421 TaxID=3234138 RepID=UPI003467CF2C